MWRGAVFATVLGLILLSGCQRYLDSKADSGINPFDDPCALAKTGDVSHLLGESVTPVRGVPAPAAQSAGYSGTICVYDSAPASAAARDVVVVTFAVSDGSAPAGGPQSIADFCHKHAFQQRANTGTPEPVTSPGDAAYLRSSTGLYFTKGHYCVNVDATLNPPSRERSIELDVGDLVASNLPD